MDHPALNLAIVQANPIVGDLAYNQMLAYEQWQLATAHGADVVVFSELFLCGYPPEDLILRPSFVEACRQSLHLLAEQTKKGAAVLIGVPWAENGHVYNAVAHLEQGQVQTVRFKHDLPNYGVFDEKRVFTAGALPLPVMVRGVAVGVAICEDIWKPEVIQHLAKNGAQLIVVPNGSPYWRGKNHTRLDVVRARVQETRLPLVYLNQIGGQDELVFDGASFVVDAEGRLTCALHPFQTGLLICRFDPSQEGYVQTQTDLLHGMLAQPLNDEAADYAACVLGLRDYVEKNKFSSVLIGLSGGVDSALTAVMAVDALGASRVRTVMLPSRYTAAISLEDAASLAKTLGVQHDTIAIDDTVVALEKALQPLFDGHPRDVTEENLQSRVRGTLLMALSNKFGAMVVTTGNKSEMSVGYATLYGDMNGGYNPLKDLYKTRVYALCHWRNAFRPQGGLAPVGQVIPSRILTRAPSAELRENQTDQDSLPDYAVLDAVLHALVEEEKSVADIVASGFAPDIVRKVEHLLAIAEYKRRQSAPGVKLTTRTFDRDRRYPITNRYREG